MLVGCATQPRPQVEMVRTEGGVGVVNPNKHVIGGPTVVLSGDDMKTLDSFWRDAAHEKIGEYQVPTAAKDLSLRLLAVMIIGARGDRPVCADFDLHDIHRIDLAAVPSDIIDKAKAQVPAPSLAEKWSVKVCDDEEKWLVIGAKGLPFITAAPSGL